MLVACARMEHRRWHPAQDDLTSHMKLPSVQVRLARRLSLEWQAYVVRTHALRKVFVTVKGFNYQVRRPPFLQQVLGRSTLCCEQLGMQSPKQACSAHQHIRGRGCACRWNGGTSCLPALCRRR